MMASYEFHHVCVIVLELGWTLIGSAKFGDNNNAPGLTHNGRNPRPPHTHTHMNPRDIIERKDLGSVSKPGTFASHDGIMVQKSETPFFTLNKEIKLTSS